MNVSHVEYRGFWAIALLSQTTIVGYWSVRRGEWICETEVADIAMWAKQPPVLEYIADNYTRLYSAPIIRDVSLAESA